MKSHKRKIIELLLFIFSSLTYCYCQKINTKYFFQTLDCFISDSYYPADQFLNPGSRYNLNTENIKYCKLIWSDSKRMNEYFYDINSNLIKEISYIHDTNTLIYEYDQFGIDSYECCKFYFALNAAICNHKKTDKGFIFACVDEDTEYVDVQVFNDVASIEKYINEYFTEQKED